MDIGRSSSTESCGGGDSALIAGSLSGDFGLGVGAEGVLGRGGAGRVLLSVELGGSVVANENSRSVLDAM